MWLGWGPATADGGSESPAPPPPCPTSSPTPASRCKITPSRQQTELLVFQGLAAWAALGWLRFFSFFFF